MEKISFFKKFKEVFDDKISRILIFIPLLVSLTFMNDKYIIILFNISFYGFMIFATNEFYKINSENKKLKDEINEYIKRKDKGEL